jgi:hypothetical protein
MPGTVGNLSAGGAGEAFGVFVFVLMRFLRGFLVTAVFMVVIVAAGAGGLGVVGHNMFSHD